MASNSKGKRNGRGATDVAQSAVRAFAELTGRRPETVLGLKKDEDGWKVTLETVELRRVPNSSDVLASYVIALDDEGEVIGYERVRRYQRAETGGEGG